MLEGGSTGFGPKGDTDGRPESIGRYDIVDTLGAGGHGKVYRAFDPELDREVALKVLRPPSPGGTGGVELQMRLVREAQAVAKVNHPNVVQVFDVGTDGERVYVAMELVAGVTLAQWLDVGGPGGPRSRREIVAVFIHAGRGLAAAHRAGLVHRDFKPGNVLVGNDGRIRVVDFGLARMLGTPTVSLDDAQTQSRGGTVDLLDAELTGAGLAMGTRAYMAPEQHRREGTDERTDVYAFCVALVEALIGAKPFVAATPEALFEHKLARRWAHPDRIAALPRRLRNALVRGLHPEPQGRWPTIDALLRRLQPPRRRVWGLAAALGLGVGGLAIWQLGAPASRCDAGAVDFWGDADTGDLGPRFLASGTPGAELTADRVESRLATYAQMWTATKAVVCRDHPAETLDRATACLRRAQTRAQAARNVLAEADADAVVRAVEVVDSLPSIAQCNDPEALRTGIKPPADPDTAARVAAVEPDLARAIAMQEAGRYADALVLAQDVADRLERIGYRPLWAETAYRVAWLQKSTGDLEAARATLETAYWTASEEDHHEAAAAAATEMAIVLGHELRDPDRAKTWGRNARAAAARLGDDHVANAVARDGLAVLAFEQGEYEEAARLYREALAIYQRSDEHAMFVANAEANLSAVLAALDETDEALRHAERAVDHFEQQYGPGHPKVADAINIVGFIQSRAGRNADALQQFERAIEIHEKLGIPDASAFATELANAAATALKLERHALAAGYFDRAITRTQLLVGADHAQVADLLVGAGRCAAALGNPERARTKWTRAKAIFARDAQTHENAIADVDTRLAGLEPSP